MSNSDYKQVRGSDADAMPIKRRLAEIHANRILKLGSRGEASEPAPAGDSAELQVDEPAA